MSMLPVGIGSAEAGGYQIERSLRFNSADSAYLNRTPASATNRQTWTWSGWVKRGTLGSWQIFFGAWDGVGGNDTTRLDLSFEAADTISITGGVTVFRNSTQVFRDPSAWYHIVVVADTTNATAQNRLRIYVNGVEITNWGTNNTVTLNTSLAVNNNASHVIGARGNSPTQYLNGYLTEINFIDGQALTPSSFGETDTVTGVWKPKAYSGSYGTNGFYLKFADNSGTTSTTLGKDSSGNGNNWTPNNFSVTAGAGNDSLVDTPTNYGTDTGVGGEVRGNYCTLNPLDKDSDCTLTNGNLDANIPNVNAGAVRGTFGMSSGKWYYEFLVGSTPGLIGVARGSATLADYPGSDANGWSVFGFNGYKYNGTDTAYGDTWTTNDLIGVAIDMDGGKIWWAKNGTWQASGDPVAGTNAAFSNLSGTVFPAAGAPPNTGYGLNGVFNFGQRPFAYTAPSGFKALCTQNLPEPTIKDGGDYFNTVLYTGNGSTQSITGVGFQPDWVWAKSRSSADANFVLDSVRGATNNLYTNGTAAEFTQNTVTAFNADGFSVGSQANGVNTNGNSYVAWNWKANGAGSTNTAGTITSTVSVNTTSGFSIVTFTGTGSTGTVGHGLGVTPVIYLVKKRSGTSGWAWFTTAIDGSVDFLFLNTTDAKTDTGVGYSTLPTSTVFSLGAASASINDSGGTYVAYCLAQIPGYSAFGSYTGNGSADGTFVYTGFRPAFVMVKRTDDVNSWNIWDDKRNPYNQQNNVLYANTSAAEDTRQSDFISNGFKLRGTSTEFNASGGTYIYMAFAESPFRYSLAR